MTTPSAGLTTTDLIASTSEILLTAHYQQIKLRFPEWDSSSSRLFEDEYNIVGIVVFDTCGELLRKWPDLQGSLVDVISRHVTQNESKSWDGYLILLTPGPLPSGTTEIDTVRYNTTRLRKIVATGDDIRNLSDVERVIRPLLPLGLDQTKLNLQSALDLLPGLLAVQGIPEETTRLLIEAFRTQAPLLEQLHRQQEAQ